MYVSWLDKISSIDKNKIIRAVNAGQENPFPDGAERERFYNELVSEKTKLDAMHPELPLVFALVEPDEEEEALLDALMPDGFEV